MVSECYNPIEMRMHNKLGLECDGYLHLNAPDFPPKETSESDSSPPK